MIIHYLIWRFMFIEVIRNWDRYNFSLLCLFIRVTPGHDSQLVTPSPAVVVSSSLSFPGSPTGVILTCESLTTAHALVPS